MYIRYMHVYIENTEIVENDLKRTIIFYFCTACCTLSLWAKFTFFRLSLRFSLTIFHIQYIVITLQMGIWIRAFCAFRYAMLNWNRSRCCARSALISTTLSTIFSFEISISLLFGFWAFASCQPGFAFYSPVAALVKQGIKNTNQPTNHTEKLVHFFIALI